MTRMIGLLLIVLAPIHVAGAVDVVTAEAATRSQLLSGYTRARIILHLSAEESGRVAEVFADIGDPIPDAGHFTCLDDTYNKLEQRANQAGQARIKVDIAHVRKQVKRYQSLVKSNSSAQIQLDETRRSLDSNLKQLEELMIQSEVLAERLRRSCVSAPPGWLVMDREVEPGQWVNKGQQVARVGDYSRLLIPFALSNAEFNALQQTSDLQLWFPDLGKHAAARIARVSPTFDEASRKIRVELEVQEGLDELRGGMRAELSLRLSLNSGAVMVPRGALDERYEQYWLKREDGSEIKVVYLGRDDAGRVRVVSPEIAPGQRFQIIRR